VPFVLIVLVAWGTVLGQGPLPHGGRIERKSRVMLVAAGVLTATSSLLVFRALSLGDASRGSPMTNVALVFSVTLAAIFLKEKLTWQVVLEAALMVGGVLLIALAKPAEKNGASKKNGRPASGTTTYESNT